MQPSALVTKTQCKLCGQDFGGNPAAEAVKLARNPKAKIAHLQALLAPLMKHLQKHHPDVLQHSQLQGSKLAGLLAMNAFVHGEPIMREQQEAARSELHRITRAAQVSDERIHERLMLAYINAPTYDVGRPTHTKRLRSLTEATINERLEAEQFVKGYHGRAILETFLEMRDVLEERRAPSPQAVEPAGEAPATPPQADAEGEQGNTGEQVPAV